MDEINGLRKLLLKGIAVIPIILIIILSIIVSRCQTCSYNYFWFAILVFFEFYCLPNLWATTIAVPQPHIGSKTISVGFDDAFMMVV